jgi:DNA ligase-1
MIAMSYANGSFVDSKFFGQPNGSKPAPAKQSKLAFSSKSNPNKQTTSSALPDENDDVDMKDEDSDAEVKPVVEKGEDVDKKENVKPEKGRSSQNNCCGSLG